MTFQEIKDEITALLAVNDFAGVAALITPENVDTVVRCNGTTLIDAFQYTSNPTELLGYYMDLLFLIEAAKVGSGVADILPLFVPYHVLSAQVGKVYEETYNILFDWYTDLGYADPTIETETGLLEFYETLTEEGQQKNTSIC